MIEAPETIYAVYDEDVSAQTYEIYAQIEMEGFVDTPTKYIRADIASAQLADARKVKALVWSPEERAPEGSEYRSLTLVGSYYIGFGATKGGRYVEYNGNPLSCENGVYWFGSLKAAKAAAQADYERRILSALEGV